MSDIKQKNVINLKELLQRGVYVEKVRDFEKSIYSDVYKNAFFAVERIVEDNRKKNQRAEYHQKKLEKIEIPNVVSFIGRRGTGKTSAMLSFQNALETYHERRDNGGGFGGIGSVQAAGMENTRFFSAGYIDASALEESEDVFSLVLARMFQFLERTNKKKEWEEDCRNKKLLQQLGDIYEDFMEVKNAEAARQVNIYTSIEQLAHVANSQDIRLKFHDVVRDFLSYIDDDEQPGKRESYLVIAIDDIDMACYNSSGPDGRMDKKTYEIINSIHKYMSIPQVIVLSAYNHVNLMRQSVNFFIGSDRTEYTDEADRGERRKTGVRISNQFIDKVFLLDYRVYLPSWKKSDFIRDKFRINVLDGNGVEDRENIFEKYLKRERGRRFLTVKEFILILYASKIGVYFDFKGKKIHFLEPDSLRRLVNLINLFGYPRYSLEEAIPETEKEEYRKKIFKRVKGDVYFRFIQENLSFPREKELFDELMEFRIDRRSQEIVKRYCGRIVGLGKRAKKEVARAKAEQRYNLYYKSNIAGRMNGMDQRIAGLSDNSEVKYSLAELLHVLYHMTRGERRLGPEAGEALASKEFVDCILYSYSIALSEIYDDYRSKKRLVGKRDYIHRYRFRKGNRTWSSTQDGGFEDLEEDYEILKGVIGDTVCGGWAEYFFPEIYFGYFQKYARPQKGDTSNTECINAGRMTIVKTRISFTLKWMELDYENMIRAVVALSMLYADVPEWNTVELDFTSGTDGFALEITIADAHAFEVTAFIKNAFLYPEFLHKIERLLSEAFARQEKEMAWKEQRGGLNRGEKERIGSFQGLLSRLESANRKVFDELWAAFYQWDEEMGTMALPVHNFDLMYNLIKHMYQDMDWKRNVLKLETAEDFWKAFDRMNGMIADYLREADDFYTLKGNGRCFKAIFCSCPFLELVKEDRGTAGEDTGGVNIRNDIGSYIMDKMVDMLVYEQQLTPGDEGIKDEKP